MTGDEVIRTLKAMQTRTLEQCAALRGLASECAEQIDEDGRAELDRMLARRVLADLGDAEVTARNHVQALEHVIAILTGSNDA